jgi:hypothetical protein
VNSFKYGGEKKIDERYGWEIDAIKSDTDKYDNWKNHSRRRAHAGK